MATVPSGTEPRAPNAPAGAGAAFSETILAGRPSRLARADSALGLDGGTAVATKTFAETLRSVPVAIQGLWVGLACIVLLVSSAAALRSLSTSNVGAAPQKPLPLMPTGSGTGAATAPVASSPGTAAQPAASTPGSMNIGGGGGSNMAGFGALAIRDRLPAHVRLRRFGAFMDDLERLLALDSTAIDRQDVRKLIADAAVYGMMTGPNGALSPDGERIFTFLTSRAGAAGPDILFDLVTTRGGARAATYAEEALKREDLRAKGTPAFRIAYDLRVASTCQARSALLERVKTDGDRRVLATLFQMARCGHGPTDCCTGTDAGYKEAVRVINAKK